MGTLKGSLMETWIGRSYGRRPRTLIGKEELRLDVQGDLDQSFNRKTNKNFDWKGGIMEKGDEAHWEKG